MTQDIMRRVLRDYFGYEVHFVMNITDVDDKVRFELGKAVFKAACADRPVRS